MTHGISYQTPATETNARTKTANLLARSPKRPILRHSEVRVEKTDRNAMCSAQSGTIVATPNKEPKSGRNPVVHPTARRYGPQKSMSTAAAIAEATTSDCADSGGTMAKVTASITTKPRPSKASRGMRFIIVAIVANSIYGHYTKSAADAPQADQ